jgi:hypothetical protein
MQKGDPAPVIAVSGGEMDPTSIIESNRSKLVVGASLVAAGLAIAATTTFVGDNTSHQGHAPSRNHGGADGGAAKADNGNFATEIVPQLTHASGTASRRVTRATASGEAATTPDLARPSETTLVTGEASAPSDASQPPHKVTFTLPQYHSGTSPTITPPSASGSPPSVSTDDGSVSITIPTDGEVTPPTYTPGQSGHLDPPGVSVD